MSALLMASVATFSTFLVSTKAGAEDTQLPYADTDFPCISQRDAQTFVRDFTIRSSSFGGMELCQSASDFKKLMNDLVIIRDGKFGEPVSNPLSPGWIRQDDYYSWMKSQTRSVRRGHDIPYATAYNSGGNFTMQDGWSQLSTLGRVGTIIHEARHTAGYRHVQCNQGPYQPTSVSGCDTALSSGGSHGVEMEYYARVVLQGKNFHPVYQSMARLMALARSNFVFNHFPIRKREILVAQEMNRPDTLHVWDPDYIAVRSIQTDLNPAATMKRTSFGVSFFENRQAVAIDLYSQLKDPIALGDVYSYFKLMKGSDSEIEQIVDMEEFDVGSVRYVVAMNRAGRLASYQFGQGRWGTFSTESIPAAIKLVTTAPNGAEGLFILTTEGKVIPYIASQRRLGPALPVLWPSDVSGYVNWKGKLTELHSDGIAWTVNSTTQARTPNPDLKGVRISQIVRAPAYESFPFEFTGGTEE